jgi:hypothetical protein
LGLVVSVLTARVDPIIRGSPVSLEIPETDLGMFRISEIRIEEAPTLGKAIPTLAKEIPTLAKEIPILGREIQTLGRDTQTLAKEIPILDKETLTRGKEGPGRGYQDPSQVKQDLMIPGRTVPGSGREAQII